MKKFKNIEAVPRFYITHLRLSAKNRDIEYLLNDIDLVKQWNKQKGICKFSGIHLSFDSTTYKNDGTASLDRINSNKGYIKGNIQWVHKQTNIMKMKMSDKQFIKMCHKISKYQKLKTKTK